MFIDISTPESINAEFAKQCEIGSHDNPIFELIGKSFFHLLTEENKRFYLWVHNPRQYQPQQPVVKTGIDYESKILRRQECSGWLD